MNLTRLYTTGMYRHLFNVICIAKETQQPPLLKGNTYNQVYIAGSCGHFAKKNNFIFWIKRVSAQLPQRALPVVST